MVLETLGINTNNWFGIILVLVITFAVGFFILAMIAIGALMLLFNKKSYIYKMYGDTNAKLEKDDAGNPTGIKVEGNNLILGQVVIKRSMSVVKNNVQISRIFYFPWFKETLPIPSDYTYMEGNYFLQVGKDLFPIKKPKITVKGEIITELQDISNWIKWYYSEATGFIEKKFPEHEAQVRIMAIIIVGVIAIVILAGFNLYLSYKYTGQLLPSLNGIKAWFEANPGGIRIPQ